MIVYITQKENGFMFSRETEETDTQSYTKEMVIEGKDPKKIGAAVLALFQKPRTPRKKKEVSA